MAECDLDYVIIAENHDADWRDRYETTIQAKDAQIGDMQASLDGLDAVLIDKDAQIAELVGLVQELRDCVMDDGLPCNCGTLRDGSQYECIQCRSYTAIREDMGL